MTLTELKPGDLAIYVEVECVGCFDCQPNAHTEGRILMAGGTPHHACHGSGKRAVTLAGRVKIELASRKIVDWYCFPGVPLLVGTPRFLYKCLVKRINDGTCPDEIMAQLHEVKK